jgi:hypothetical protein
VGNIKDDQKPRASKERTEYSENQFLDRIKRIPPLTNDEALVLFTCWQEFADIKARNWAIEGSLHLVLPIAKSTTKRFKFYGPAFMPRYCELIAAGSLGLTEAANAFDPDRGHPFENYARRCISREVIRAAKRFLSVIDHPYYARTPADIQLDMTLPDMVSTEDYCGSRARKTTAEGHQDVPLGSVHGRLRPWPQDWEVKFKDEQCSIGSKIYDLRMAGFTLKQTAESLGMSLTTVWRRQQAYMETRYGC